MPSPLRHLRWYIGGLLFLSTVINYIDRQTLSVLGPILKDEFQLDQFRLCTARDRLPRGLRVRPDRERTVSRPRRYARRADLTVAFYSTVAMLASLAAGLRSFCAVPLPARARRIGELAGRHKSRGRMVPPPRERMGSGALRQRFSIGAAVAPFIVLGVYQATGSWRPAFIVTGVLGFLWMPLFRALYRPPEDHPRLSPEERHDILTNRATGRCGDAAARRRLGTERCSRCRRRGASSSARR